MPAMRTAPDAVIELPSSPSPPIRQPLRRGRSASAQPSHGSSMHIAANTKGKGKAVPRLRATSITTSKSKPNSKLVVLGPVIEITDSEDDVNDHGARQIRQQTPLCGSTATSSGASSSSSQGTSSRPRNPVAGPSNFHPKAQLKVKLTPSKSYAKPTPLFLRSPHSSSSEDDEGEGLLSRIAKAGGVDDEVDEDEMDVRIPAFAKGKGKARAEDPPPPPPALVAPAARAEVDVGDAELQAAMDRSMHDEEEDEVMQAMINQAIELSRAEAEAGAALAVGGVAHFLDNTMGGPLHAPEAAVASNENQFDAEEGFPAFALQQHDEAMDAGPALAPASVPAAARAATPPAPLPEPPASPATLASRHVFTIIPSISPDYIAPLIQEHLPTFDGDSARTAEHVVAVVFETYANGDWPRAEKKDAKGKGKRKSEANEDDEERRENKKPRVDWASTDRLFEGGKWYTEFALIHLQTSFPHIPKAYLRRSLILHGSHYAPTHLSLLAAEAAQEGPKPYTRKSTRYNPAKDLAKAVREGWNEPILEEEKRWIDERIQGPDNAAEDAEENALQDKGKGKSKAVDPEAESDDEDLPEGEGIECQCCFSNYRFHKMVQCPEAHLFCTSCISQYASTQLGGHSSAIICMHSSDCKLPFPVSELRRVLPTKLMELYERVKQQKEIEDAGLEGLEACPFCEWKCVMEASKEQERLFRCGNEEGGCGVVSCRECAKEDHLPKSCKEAEEDKHLDGQHAIEEAMSKALMRNCPKCKKPFIKDQGCNKMTCPNCRTLSCYVCRAVISGYDHFDQRAPNAPGPSRQGGGKCLLWEEVEKRHADEVKSAAEKALAEYKTQHPDLDPDALRKIKVDIPKAPVVKPGALPQGYIDPAAVGAGMHMGWGQPAAMGGHNAFNFAAMQGVAPIPAYPHHGYAHGLVQGNGAPGVGFHGHLMPAPLPVPVPAPIGRGRDGRARMAQARARANLAAQAQAQARAVAARERVERQRQQAEAARRLRLEQQRLQRERAELQRENARREARRRAVAEEEGRRAEEGRQREAQLQLQPRLLQHHQQQHLPVLPARRKRR